MITYSEETIKNALMLLNNIETKGIENAKRIVLISQLLDTPERGADNGNNNEEV